MQGRGGRQPGAGAGAAEDQPGPAGPDQPPDGRAGATLAGVEVAKHVAWPVNSTVSQLTMAQVRLLKKCKFLIEKDHSEKEMAVQVAHLVFIFCSFFLCWKPLFVSI